MTGAAFPSRSELRSYQLEQLKRLLEAVIPANPFYTSKLRSNGRQALPLAELSAIAQLPFTIKPELIRDQEDHPPYGTNLSAPLSAYTHYHQTSGTTGTPLRWLDTPEGWDWMIERWLEIFRAAEVHREDRIVFAFSFGPFIGFWLAFEAGTRLGALCLPAGGLSSVARVHMILDNAATVLCCTPTYALRLAEAAQQDRIDLSPSRVRRIIVAGEPGGSIPNTRQRIESLWPGAKVFDHHGMTETGPVSYECPARPGYLHVMESGFLAEIVDPGTGKPVPAGSSGELILTTLGRVASPLIRYRTGDLVKAEAATASAPCVCGRNELVLEGGILGRVDDMIIVRGVNIYPSAVEQLLRGCGGIAEYQVKVTQDGPLAELSVLIELEPGSVDPQELLAAVRKQMQQAFALRVPVHLVAHGTLPRFEMKARRWTVQK
jgi:phenylacetate-CoA ligase